MISAASTSLAEACVRRRSNVSDLPRSRGPHRPGHRRLQRNRPRYRPGALAAARARFRAASDAIAAALDLPGASRSGHRAGLRRGRSRSSPKAGEHRSLCAFGGHLQRRADREHLRLGARGDVPRQRLLRVLPGAGVAPARPAQRRPHRQHRRAARRAGAFALRGLQGRAAVDDDVHRGGAGSPDKGQPGLAGLGAHADGRGIAAAHRPGPDRDASQPAGGRSGRRGERRAVALQRRLLALHRAGSLRLGRCPAGGAARAGEAGVRLSPRELHRRAAEAREHYARCDLCAHLCGVDRTRGPAGVCQEGDGLWLAGAGIHYGEEPQLVPSGLVLIAGCNLACQSCETWEFSLERRGAVPVRPDQLAALLLDLQKRGARNANFVTPTHVLPALLQGIAVASEHGFALPLVWNCGGYESVQALRLLEGVVDVYLPDAKYGDDAAAFELSGCKGYAKALETSLYEMVRQVGATSVIVRHLLLPANAAGNVMPLLARISPKLWL